MRKIKNNTFFLLFLFIVLITLTFLKIKDKEEFQQKAVFAQEIKMVTKPLMIDLNQERDNILMDVPADGEWHKTKRVLIADNIGDLRIRRLKENPGVLEVQIEAKENDSLIYNLRVRVPQ